MLTERRMLTPKTGLWGEDKTKPVSAKVDPRDDLSPTFPLIIIKNTPGVEIYHVN